MITNIPLHLPLLPTSSSRLPPHTHTPTPTHTHRILEISDGVWTRLHPCRHVPVLDQTRSDHSPDTGNGALPERGAVASEVEGAIGGSVQVRADEDTLELDGAAFEFGGLEGDYDCGAIL